MQLFAHLSAYFNKTDTPFILTATNCTGMIVGALLRLYKTISDPYITQTYELAPQKITNFINKIAQTRNIDPVNVRINKDENIIYQACAAKRMIVLPNTACKKLANDNNNIHNIHKKRNALGSIHHELTHIQMNSSSTKTFLSAVTGGLTFSIAHYKLFGKYAHNNPIFYQAKNAIACLAGVFFCKHLYSKLDETWADDGIPNEIELLKSKQTFFENLHRQKIEDINNLKQTSLREALSTIPLAKCYTYPRIFAKYYIPTKYFEKSALLCDLILHTTDPHPSHLFRAKRFESRIAAIEVAEKSKNQ